MYCLLYMKINAVNELGSVSARLIVIASRARLPSYNPRVFTLSWWVLKNLRALEPLDRFALPPPGKSWTFTWNYMNIPMWTWYSIRHTNNFYRPQRSCGKVIIFTSVCQEFCPRGWGWVSASVHAGIHPPGRHPPGRHPPPNSRRLLQRTVRILLECILVLTTFCGRNFINHIWIKITTIATSKLPIYFPSFELIEWLCKSGLWFIILLYNEHIPALNDGSTPWVWQPTNW